MIVYSNRKALSAHAILLRSSLSPAGSASAENRVDKFHKAFKLCHSALIVAVRYDHNIYLLYIRSFM
jgi:hypothetical protein